MATDRTRFKNVLKAKEAEALFTRRQGGVSSGVYGGFNLAYHVGDNTNNVRQNRMMLSSSLVGNRIVFMNQQNGDDVVEVRDMPQSEPECDALVTNVPNLGLAVLMADCAGILLFDKENIAVAAIHAGRAGICKKILSKTLEKMSELYGTKAENVTAFVSAFIRAENYEIGDMDLGEFNKFKTEDGRHFDIEAALKAEFEELGISEVKFDGACTFASEADYFSYRRDGATGRFAGVINIKEAKS